MGRQSLKTRANRSGGALSPAQQKKQRTAAIEQMNKRLRRKFTQVETQINDLRAENIRYYHQIGQIVLDIKQKPEDYVGDDGTPGIKLLELALSTQARLLRKTATFAEQYREPELNRLIGMFHKETNFKLHWGHISFLITLPSPELREKYAMESVEKMLDPPALHELIKKRQNRGGGHGRAHELPATVAAQVRQIRKLTEQWCKKAGEVWNGNDKNVFTNVMEAEPDTIEETTLEDLQAIDTALDELVELAGSMKKINGRAKEHVAGVLKQQADVAAAEASQGRQLRNIDVGGNGGTRRRRRSA